jgi:hypothetical protein
MHKKKIKYIHNKKFDVSKHIQLTDKVIELVDKLYVLPNEIEIVFESLGKNVHGMTMLDTRYNNRIRLNIDLSIEEYIIPLTHELLHLHQLFTNRLQPKLRGKILFDNMLYKVDSLNMSYEDYMNLPWEQDVAEKQRKLLIFLQENSRKLRLDNGRQY